MILQCCAVYCLSKVRHIDWYSKFTLFRVEQFGNYILILFQIYAFRFIEAEKGKLFI